MCTKWPGIPLLSGTFCPDFNAESRIFYYSSNGFNQRKLQLMKTVDHREYAYYTKADKNRELLTY